MTNSLTFINVLFSERLGENIIRSAVISSLQFYRYLHKRVDFFSHNLPD